MTIHEIRKKATFGKYLVIEVAQRKLGEMRKFVFISRTKVLIVTYNINLSLISYEFCLFMVCIMFIVTCLYCLGHDDGRDGSNEIDPEIIRKGVRNLMHQVAQIERERVSRIVF